MNRIQKWFEILAGVPRADLDRLEIAARIFAAAPLDVASLQTPACWRRKRRIAGGPQWTDCNAKRCVQADTLAA